MSHMNPPSPRRWQTKTLSLTAAALALGASSATGLADPTEVACKDVPRVVRDATRPLSLEMLGECTWDQGLAPHVDLSLHASGGVVHLGSGVVGLTVTPGVSVDVTGLTFDGGATAVAVIADETGAGAVSLRDVIIQGTSSVGLRADAAPEARSSALIRLAHVAVHDAASTCVYSEGGAVVWAVNDVTLSYCDGWGVALSGWGDIGLVVASNNSWGGVYVQEGSWVMIDALWASDNAVAGLLAYKANFVEVANAEVGGTRLGDAQLSDGTTAADWGYGILCDDTAHFQVRNDGGGVLGLHDNRTAGILSNQCNGLIGAIPVYGNRIGIILQGAPVWPQLAAGLDVHDNTELNWVKDGNLAIPSAPAALPP